MVKYHYSVEYLSIMTKLDSLYQGLLKREVVQYKDIKRTLSKIIEKQHISSSYLYTDYINKLCKLGKLLRPQRGLYVAVPPTMIGDTSFQPDKYLIASKIQSPYYLGFHTALELYGCAYSNYNTLYIVVSHEKKFRGFEFRQINYQPVFTLHHKLGVKRRTHKGQEIYISSPSKTFLDCINRPGYAGGWEECLKSLEGLPNVTSKELKYLLNSIGKDLLFRKTGFILELFSQNPYYQGIFDDLHHYLENHLGGCPMYLRKGTKSTLNTRWKLYIPVGFEEIIKGV